VIFDAPIERIHRYLPQLIKGTTTVVASPFNDADADGREMCDR
jgi:hypothetical protein